MVVLPCMMGFNRPERGEGDEIVLVGGSIELAVSSATRLYVSGVYLSILARDVQTVYYSLYWLLCATTVRTAKY